MLWSQCDWLIEIEWVHTAVITGVYCFFYLKTCLCFILKLSGSCTLKLQTVNHNRFYSVYGYFSRPWKPLSKKKKTEYFETSRKKSCLGILFSQQWTPICNGRFYHINRQLSLDRDTSRQYVITAYYFKRIPIL